MSLSDFGGKLLGGLLDFSTGFASSAIGNKWGQENAESDAYVNWLTSSMLMNQQARLNKEQARYQWDNFSSPKAQVTALKDAGINPALAVLNGGGLGGNVDVGNVSGGSGSVHTSPAGVANSARFGDTLVDVLNDKWKLAKEQARADIRKTNAEIDTIKEEKKNILADTIEKAAHTSSVAHEREFNSAYWDAKSEVFRPDIGINGKSRRYSDTKHIDFYRKYIRDMVERELDWQYYNTDTWTQATKDAVGLLTGATKSAKNASSARSHNERVKFWKRAR